MAKKSIHKSKKRKHIKKRSYKSKSFTRKQRGGSTLLKKVWCFWLGDTPMTDQRAKCLQTIKDNIGVEVVFITDDTLGSYIKLDHPFHEAYQYLSGTHKCDYVRGYFMQHYGGGYTDIKPTTQSWEPYFTTLENDQNMWAIGYEEFDQNGVAPALNNDALTKEMKENYTKLIGNCAYICKPNTPFTREWVATVHSELDKYLPELKLHPPSTPRDRAPSESLYPITWSGILGSIFHPIAYKYSDHISTDLPPPKNENYL